MPHPLETEAEYFLQQGLQLSRSRAYEDAIDSFDRSLERSLRSRFADSAQTLRSLGWSRHRIGSFGAD